MLYISVVDLVYTQKAIRPILINIIHPGNREKKHPTLVSSYYAKVTKMLHNMELKKANNILGGRLFVVQVIVS